MSRLRKPGSRGVIGAGALTAWLLLQSGCSLGTLSTDGGGSRGGNPVVAGTIIGLDGAGLSGVRVALIDIAYNPMVDAPLKPSCSDTTDSQGRFSITAPDTGRFNIEAVSPSGNERLLVRDIVAGTDSMSWVAAAALMRSGVVAVAFADLLPDGYVYFPGTTIGATVAQTQGNVLIDQVPAGELPELRYASVHVTRERIIRRDIMVMPNDTARIEQPFWEYTRRIVLNTSSNGASVSGDVRDFPVLVRLTRANFSFNQAQSDGRDLRFTKTDDTGLALEIERWDSASGLADVWVRVDTVYGSNDSQSIFMYWGNPDAPASSSGRAVFDTARGHAGVWHLDRPCADATAHGHNGVSVGASEVDGIIGQALRFDGNSYVKIYGLLGTPQNMTLSAWADLTAVEATGAEVVSVGDAALIRMDDIWNDKGTHGAYFVDPEGGADSTHLFAKTGRFYRQTGWHYLTYAIDAAAGTQSLYVDGALVSLTRGSAPILYAGAGSDTYLAKHGNGRQGFDYTGRLDEVRVCATCRSEHWIRLCFMNQRFDDQLVRFR